MIPKCPRGRYSVSVYTYIILSHGAACKRGITAILSISRIRAALICQNGQTYIIRLLNPWQPDPLSYCLHAKHPVEISAGLVTLEGSDDDKRYQHI